MSEAGLAALRLLEAMGPTGRDIQLSTMRMFWKLGAAEWRLQNELQAELGMSSAGAKRNVDYWVKRGFAERFTDPADRRAVCVCLTPAGRAFYESLPR